MIYKSRSVENDDMGNSKIVHSDHNVGINNLVEGAEKNHDQTEEIVKEVFKIKEILTNEDEVYNFHFFPIFH